MDFLYYIIQLFHPVVFCLRLIQSELLLKCEEEELELCQKQSSHVHVKQEEEEEEEDEEWNISHQIAEEHVGEVLCDCECCVIVSVYTQ